MESKPFVVANPLPWISLPPPSHQQIDILDNFLNILDSFNINANYRDLCTHEPVKIRNSQKLASIKFSWFHRISNYQTSIKNLMLEDLSVLLSWMLNIINQKFNFLRHKPDILSGTMWQCFKKNNLIGISHCFLVPADFTPVQINKGLLFQWF